MARCTNAIITVEGPESLNRALSKLKKTLAMTGVTRTLCDREHYRKPSGAKRLKAKRARARLLKVKGGRAPATCGTAGTSRSERG